MARSNASTAPCSTSEPTYSPHTSNDERTAALDTFLHTYNYHRCHTALGANPPISRVNASQYT
jgi:transposase InsO family protein